MGFIYKISNCINEKVYIGQTTQSVESRWNQHKSKARTLKEGKLFSAIECYGEEYFKIETIEECRDSLLNEREVYWINYYDSFNNGYNMTRGGGKYREDKEEEEEILNQIYNLWDNGLSIMEISQELGLSRSIIRERIYCYKNYNEKEAIKRGIRKAKQEKFKKIYQWDKEGNFIKEYNSLQEAAKETNTSYKALSQAINKKGSSNGYFWTLTREKPENLSVQNCKKVAQYDLQGNLIKIFNSRKEAAEAVNGDPSSINKCCKGIQKTSKGYIWKNI